MKLSYFPGCSLTGTANEYDRSIRELAELMDLELTELDDWNCCGASSAHMTDQDLGLALSVRNLEIADGQKNDLLVPCSACFQRLRAADAALKKRPAAERPDYRGRFEILHITQLLARRDMLVRIAGQVQRSLGGLKLACYYGCLSMRPPALTGAVEHENPRTLDRLMAAVGADCVRWSHKTECCSGSLTMARPDIARELIADIVAAARRGGAQAIVTDCPMCQANLESRQLDLLKASGQETLPVFFGTELLAHALAPELDRGRWKKHLIDPGSLLAGTGEQGQ